MDDDDVDDDDDDDVTGVWVGVRVRAGMRVRMSTVCARCVSMCDGCDVCATGCMCVRCARRCGSGAQCATVSRARDDVARARCAMRCAGAGAGGGCAGATVGCTGWVRGMTMQPGTTVTMGMVGRSAGMSMHGQGATAMSVSRVRGQMR